MLSCSSTLALLVAGIVADHEHDAAAADNLAVFADAFDASPDLHDPLNPIERESMELPSESAAAVFGEML
jgi:hypothetical protein